MLRIPCRSVPFAALLCACALLPGCFRNHGAGEDPPTRTPSTDAAPAPRRDAGRDPRDAGAPPRVDASPTPAVDAGPTPADAGSAPAPARCESDGWRMRASRVCTTEEAGGYLWSERPSVLSLRVPLPTGACGTDYRGACDVTVGDGVVDVCVGVVPGEGDAPCPVEITVECEVPALGTEGTHRVRINGEDAFDAEAIDSRVTLERKHVCFTPAPPEGGALDCGWPGTSNLSWPSGFELCAPEASQGHHTRVTLVDSCAGCFDAPGSCRVELREGSVLDLRVEGRKRGCDCPTCGACADICQRLELGCELPDLDPGTYRLRAGLTTHTLTVDPDRLDAEILCQAADL